jgi:hypothetical protein
MKHLKIAGLCLVSMITMGMALAGSASALPLFLSCLEGSNLTKYSDDQCTNAESGGKWQSQEITTTEMTTGTGFTLTLADTKTALGVTKVRCDTGGESTGTVGPGNIAVVATAKVNAPEANCRGLEGGCESNKIEKIEGRDLPWQRSLFETEKKIVSKIENDGAGEPGWAVKCKTALGSKTDTCTSESSSKLEESEAVNTLSGKVLLITLILLNKHKGKCTEGGAESGEATGRAALLSAFGPGLELNPN